jgi:FKBP-type peptidyl-prolyl cis-trans isomerase
MKLSQLMKHSALYAATLALVACGKKDAPSTPDATDKTADVAAAPADAAKAPAPDTAAPPSADGAPADVAAPPADAQKTASGLAYKVLTPGPGGEKPAAEDTVSVHYSGWTTDGKMFDSSKKRNEPASFPLNRVIAGWTEGLQLMSKGDKYRFWIPKELAYNDRPGRPAGMLVFDVELLDIKKAPTPPEVPADVAAAPADAQKTASGLAYKVITPGKGGPKPTADATVTVHYSGWTTDGKMFDSSVTRGEPTSFPLKGVIPGWTEGLQLMEVGSKVRFWIPSELAYKDNPGGPQGTLVFDVELLSFK